MATIINEFSAADLPTDAEFVLTKPHDHTCTTILAMLDSTKEGRNYAQWYHNSEHSTILVGTLRIKNITYPVINITGIVNLNNLVKTYDQYFCLTDLSDKERDLFPTRPVAENTPETRIYSQKRIPTNV